MLMKAIGSTRYTVRISGKTLQIGGGTWEVARQHRREMGDLNHGDTRRFYLFSQSSLVQSLRR